MYHNKIYCIPLIALLCTALQLLSQEQHTNTVAYNSTQATVVSTKASCAPQLPQRPTIAEWISATLSGAQSLPLQVILSLFLGILMSLTPCIYPMIPITLSILQSQGGASLGRNFVLALSYTLGIAVTFALIGLAAAFSGNVFGSIATNPLVILLIVALLTYLAGAMLGLYELYIPRFLQATHNTKKGGSLVSAFLIGAASGTIASPCLSPGLILLLSIVTKLGSLPIGFLLLFSFGFGIGIPLLLVGTMGGSLNVLPKAGLWMVEVKRLFGILLLAMSIYYLKALLPIQALWALLAIASACIALFYHMLRRKYAQQGVTHWHTIMMALMGLISLYGISNAMAYYTHDSTYCDPQRLVWYTNYHCAREYAINEGKLLFIDIGSPSCSLCHAIDEDILSEPQVQCELERYTIPVKIDATEIDASTTHVRDTFAFYGVPALFLIDPKTEMVLQQWGPELYDKAPKDFAAELSNHY